MKEPKSLFKSKTVVFNLIVAIAGVIAFFIPSANAFVADNSAAIVGVLGVANLILRRVTNAAYQFFPVIIAGLCCLMLSSCGATWDLNSDPNDNEFRTPIGTVVRQNSDGGAKAVIDGRTVMKWTDWIARILAGQKPKDILQGEFPVVEQDGKN